MPPASLNRLERAVELGLLDTVGDRNAMRLPLSCAAIVVVSFLVGCPRRTRPTAADPADVRVLTGSTPIGDTHRVGSIGRHRNAKESHMSDYVIVGAGSAGCVLAARLAEDPDVSVALIEAGGADTEQEIHIPVAFSALFKTGLDWDLVHRARAGPRRPPLLPAARQGARRLELDQRDGLHPRQPRRLRRVGRRRGRGLGLRRRAAVLQARRGQRARRGPLPRRRRPADACSEGRSMQP